MLPKSFYIYGSLSLAVIIISALLMAHIITPDSKEVVMVEEAVKAETGIDIAPLENKLGK
jgi:hypothetical protein